MKIKEAIEQINKSIDNGGKCKSKLDEEILKIYGMSSPKMKHFLNNLHDMKDCHALHIGLLQGSTFCSSIFKNSISILGIEDWSEFSKEKYKTRSEFFRNLFMCCANNPSTVAVLEKDCFEIKLKKVKFNVFFYDGEHKYICHYNSLLHFKDVLEDVFILIVDDWNEEHIKCGTLDVLKDLNYKIEYSVEKKSRFNGDIRGWWNGLFVAVINKKGEYEK